MLEWRESTRGRDHPRPDDHQPARRDRARDLSTTCGSDLHFIVGYIPTMRRGDVIGHEFIAATTCGRCATIPTPMPSSRSRCSGTRRRHLWLHPRIRRVRGSHAQYVRVPHADTDCFVIPEGVTDEQALFMSDAAPTGYMGAEFCNIRPGDTVAVSGCGGVGLMAQRSALLLGAGRVIGARGELDPSFLVTHRFSLEDAPRGYEMFKHKIDGCYGPCSHLEPAVPLHSGSARRAHS